LKHLANRPALHPRSTTDLGDPEIPRSRNLSSKYKVLLSCLPENEFLLLLGDVLDKHIARVKFIGDVGSFELSGGEDETDEHPECVIVSHSDCLVILFVGFLPRVGDAVHDEERRRSHVGVRLQHHNARQMIRRAHMLNVVQNLVARHRIVDSKQDFDSHISWLPVRPPNEQDRICRCSVAFSADVCDFLQHTLVLDQESGDLCSFSTTKKTTKTESESSENEYRNGLLHFNPDQRTNVAVCVCVRVWQAQPVRSI